jgi:hypothetical protein
MSITNRRSFLARSAAIAAVPAVAAPGEGDSLDPLSHRLYHLVAQLGVLPDYASAVGASAH